MKKRLVKIAAGCLALALPLCVLGEPNGGGGPRKGGGPGGQQGSGGPTSGGPMGGGPMSGGGRMDGRGGPGGGDRSNWESAEDREKFKAEVEAFCKLHAPKRWEDFKAKNDRSPDRGRMVWGMAMRYRNLQAMEKDDKELYDIKIKQIEIEDAEFGIRKELEKSGVTDAEKETLKLSLRDNAKAYVAESLKERKHRIDRLEKLIEREKQTLAKDQDNPGALINERYDRILKEGPDFFGPKPMKPRPEAGESPGAQKMKEQPSTPVSVEAAE